MKELGARAIALGIFGLFMVLLILFGVSQCTKRQSAETQGKVDRGQAGASIDSGAEASNTLGNIMESGAQTDAAVKEGQDAIRAAPESERGARTVDAACKLRAYRDSERCARLRAANPAKPSR